MMNRIDRIKHSWAMAQKRNPNWNMTDDDEYFVLTEYNRLHEVLQAFVDNGPADCGREYEAAVAIIAESEGEAER